MAITAIPYTSVILVTAGKLLGNSTGVTAAAEAISIGTGLSLSAGTLTCTVSGGIGGSTGVTENAILRADGTGGATAQSSLATIADTGAMVIAVSASSAIPAIFKGAASQTANLTEWQNSSGTVLSYVTSSGSCSIAGGLSVGDPLAPIDGGLLFARAGTDEPFVRFRTGGGATAGSQIRGIHGGGIRITDDTNVTDLVKITSNGYLGIRNSSPSALLHVSSPTTSVVVAAVQGGSSQTANLTEWQNSSGTVLSAMAKNGAYKPASLADADAENNTVYYSTTASKLVYKDSGGVVNNLY